MYSCVNDIQFVPFNWRTCTNTWKWAVMYSCVNDIQFVSFYVLGIWFWNFCASVVFFCFIMNMKVYHMYIHYTTYYVLLWTWRYITCTYIIQPIMFYYEHEGISHVHTLYNLLCFIMNMKVYHMYIHYTTYYVLLWTWRYITCTYIIQPIMFYYEHEGISHVHTLYNLLCFIMNMKVYHMYIHYTTYYVLLWTWRYITCTYIIQPIMFYYEHEGISHVHTLYNLLCFIMNMKVYHMYIHYTTYYVLLWTWRYITCTYIIQPIMFYYEHEGISHVHTLYNLLCFIMNMKVYHMYIHYTTYYVLHTSWYIVFETERKIMTMQRLLIKWRLCNIEGVIIMSYSTTSV